VPRPRPALAEAHLLQAGGDAPRRGGPPGPPASADL